MPQVIKVTDQPNLFPTKDFPYAHFPFEEFNPVQSRLVDFLEGDTNVIIASGTSSGKTICSEMYLSYGFAKNPGKKGMYISPLKALAQEKLDDWGMPDHHFYGKKLSICTGDYKLTSARKKELEESDLIIMTSEMLSSRSRNFKSEKNNFLKDIGTVVVDESHLLTVPGRGDHLENALMKITEINPDVRMVLLSATMPNVGEVCQWLSKLTNRDTYYLESSYRPCPLTIHYHPYYDGEKYYDDNEAQKVNAAMEIVDDYPEDKFIIFVHTKRTGELVKQTLQQKRINCEFHNANLALDKRLALEKKFKEDPNFRIIVATSTIAWGVNLPARRVIIVGVHRAFQVVENYDIAQECGRAGRPKYDPAGDAYILVPQSKKEAWKAKLEEKKPIRSQMLVDVSGNGHYKVLAFHLVSEIHYGNVKTVEDIHRWFSRTFAYHQSQILDNAIVDRVLQLLLLCKAIVEENGEYTCTSIGTIASMFYFSPFDVADLKNNFTKLFNNKSDDDDVSIAVAMANLDTHKFGICNKSERTEMEDFARKVYENVSDPVKKVAFAYYCMLNGTHSPVFSALIQTLKVDSARLMEVLGVVDGMSGKWGKKSYIDSLKTRLLYGVKPELLELCSIPNIGKVRAEKLYQLRIRTAEDFVKYEAKLPLLLNMSREKVNESVEGAKKIHLQKTLG